MTIKFQDESDNPIPGIVIDNELNTSLTTDNNGEVTFTEGTVFTRNTNTAPPSEIAKVTFNNDFHQIILRDK